MAVKHILHPRGHKLFFGRRRPKTRLHLQLRDYLLPKGLPPPPLMLDYYTTPTVQPLSQMYGNDTVGDCVEAEMLHTVGVLTGNAGSGAVFTTDQAISLYSSITGYNPSDPSTDQGTDIPTALSYWTQHPILGAHQITGSLAVDATNQNQVKSALWLTENLMLGLELPDAWVSPAPGESGFVWDLSGTGDPENGHCILAFSYDSLGVLVSTWGMVGHLTWAALAEYCASAANGELYTVLSTDQLSKAKALTPKGLNWAQLESDFAALAALAS
jgi:hypothetical protein